MMGRWSAVFALVVLTACGGAPTPRTPVIAPPREPAMVVFIGPGDARRGHGLSTEEREIIDEGAWRFTRVRGHDFAPYAHRRGPHADRLRQLILLHDAVADTLLAVEAQMMRLDVDNAGVAPRSLGSGVQHLAELYGADLALFMSLRGKAGVAAREPAPVRVGAEPADAPQTPRDAVFSLVDVTSGEVVWFSTAEVRVSRDVGTVEDAQAAFETWLQGAPL